MRFVTAKYVADEMLDRYGIAMEEWDVIKQSASCLKRIGLYGTRKTTYITTVKNFKVHLPCNAYLLRACVRVPSQLSTTRFFLTDGIQQPPQTFWVSDEEQSPSTIRQPDAFNIEPNAIDMLNGDYIDHTYEHPILKFNETNVGVVIQYTGLAVDDNEMPLIPEACWEACMMYCVFTRTQAEYRRGQVPRAVALDFKVWKDEAIAQARAKATMEEFTQNELDKLLNIMVSMDRKAYNLPS